MIKDWGLGKLLVIMWLVSNIFVPAGTTIAGILFFIWIFQLPT